MTDNPRVLSVVFVCTGNICRSAMAEKVYAAALDREGLGGQVEVSSAGTGPWHVGEPADARAAAVLRRHGYPVEHVARQVNPEHLEADLLLAATADHADALTRALRRAGDESAAERVRLVRSFDPAAAPGAELPDPYYGGDRGFGEVLDMVESAMPGLLAWTRERLELA